MNERPNIIEFPGRPGDPAPLQFRVELVLVGEPVWRRLVMPGRCSFWDLHVAIQDALGWRDRHLHLFTLDDPDSDDHLRVGIPDDDSFHGLDHVLAGWEHPVRSLCRPGDPPFLYTYDFAVNWQHEITLEVEVPGWSAAGLPACTEGAGLGPGEAVEDPSWKRSGRPRGKKRTFDPAAVVFDNPRERWHRAFGHD